MQLSIRVFMAVISRRGNYARGVRCKVLDLSELDLEGRSRGRHLGSGRNTPYSSGLGVGGWGLSSTQH